MLYWLFLIHYSSFLAAPAWHSSKLFHHACEETKSGGKPPE